MNATRAIIMVVGLLTVVLGAYLLWFQADLSRWVSIGVLTAGILLFLGVVVMMFAGSAPADRSPANPATTVVATAPPSSVVQENRPVTQRNQPR